MELDSKEWNLTNSQDAVLSGPNDLLESNKHKHLEESESVATKRQKLSTDNENLECLRNICETVLEDGAANLPSALPTEQSEVKPSTNVPKKKKTRKKKTPAEAPNNKLKEVKPKNEKSKSHMRKNIRDILKGDELEAETRAAQQREIERVQRLQQQQQHQIAECSFVPSFSGDEDNAPASTLVEDLQALAKELEDSTLSPEIPSLEFLDSQHFEQTSSVSPTANPVNKVSFMFPFYLVFQVLKNYFFLMKETNQSTSARKNIYDDVICLSSDDEEFPPKPTVPAPSCPKRYVPDDDDDDVVILSGAYFTIRSWLFLNFSVVLIRRR